MSCLGSYKLGDTTTSGEVIALIHGQSMSVLVFEDANGRTSWETKLDPPAPREAQVHNLHSRLFGRAGRIKDTDMRREIENELARALFRALHEGDAETAISHFVDVEARIAQDALVRARLIYAATGCVGAAFLVVILASLRAYTGDTPVGELLMGAGVGAAGAWVSVVQRSWKLRIAPFELPLYLAFQGATRIALGALFGGFAVVAIKAGLVLAPLAETSWGLAALSFAGGASERLIPELLRGTESVVLHESRSPES